MKSFVMFASLSLLLSSAAIAAPQDRVDARFQQIDANLDANIRTGVLTPAEQQSLRGRLQAIRANRDRLAVNGFTNAEADEIMAKLNQLDGEIQRQSQDKQSAQPQRADSFPAFQRQLGAMRSRLQAGITDRSLTAAEAGSIRTSLDRLQVRLDAAKADGRLTGPERQDLQTRFTVASGEIMHERHDAR